ncbi:MAG: aminoglycoside phosphotransferase family protein [Pseudomonadota bacterium]
MVSKVRAEYGTSISIVRLLHAERVDDQVNACYLAECGDVHLLPLKPSGCTLIDDALRLPYAELGGAAAELDWAQTRLAELGHRVTEAHQVRTWNLSSIWAMQCGSEKFWLKTVPPFFAHEGAVLELLQEEAVPTLLCHAGARCLLADLPGEDQYGAPLSVILDMVEYLVELQWRWRNRTSELLAAGVPDHRLEKLREPIQRVVADYAGHLPTATQQRLSDYIDGLPEKLHELEACGLPATLVHGDYHPGNWRGVGNHLSVLDWGDCLVGHPLLDLSPVLRSISADDHDVLQQHWAGCWQRKVPAADVFTAMTLIKPLAALRMAAVYQMFLENIEASEQVYHRDDPLQMIERACAELDQIG